MRIEMSDAELIALAALVQLEAVQQAGDNQLRAQQGRSPAWGVDSGGYYSEKLHAELVRRGALKTTDAMLKGNTHDANA